MSSATHALVAQALRARCRSTIIWARPSTMAVLPTPGSPISTGLFFLRRDRICITRSISSARPMIGSSLPWRASSVRSRPKWSSAGVLLFFSPLGVRDALPPMAARRRLRRGARLAAEQLQRLAARVLEAHAQLAQHLGRDPLLLAQQARAAGAPCPRRSGSARAPRPWRTPAPSWRGRYTAARRARWWPSRGAPSPRRAPAPAPGRRLRLFSTAAATPSPSRMRPSRMCSVPT